MVVTTLTQLKRQVRWPYRRLCRSLGVPYGSFRRWKRRLERGQPAVSRPGPKKVAPLTLEELHGDLYRLKHGRRRSRGVGAVYRQYHTQVSRRELQALTDTVRRELAQRRQAELRQITWHVPGLVWSLDDAELARLAHHPLRLHQVQDLASRYKFTPWVGERVLGETVAVHLEQLFLQHGPPLVLKRDNGSNLNQQAVDEVLARYLVIPLNSPPPVSALQRWDGTRGPGTETSAGGEAPRQRSDPGVPGARLGGGVGARTEPSPPPLSRWASGLQGVSGCEARPEGVYSPQAKGGLRWDQRTDPDAHAGPGGSHPASSRNSPASGGGNLVTKQRRDHHHSEQESVTHFPQTNRS